MPLPIVAQAVTPRVRSAGVKPQAEADVEETSPVEELVAAPKEEENVPPEMKETVSPESKESASPEPVIPSSSPFVPENTTAKPVRIKEGPAIGAVAGSGLLAALALPALGSRESPQIGSSLSPEGAILGGLPYSGYNNPSTDYLTGSPAHSFSASPSVRSSLSYSSKRISSRTFPTESPRCLLTTFFCKTSFLHGVYIFIFKNLTNSN